MKHAPILLLTWLGAAVRWRGLFANSFHTDEALFASWGRLIGLWRDPLLLTVGVVDKPPLLFYTQAIFYPLVGQVEWAARLPNFVAGVVLVPLTAVLAYRLTADRQASTTAALLVALSPLAIQFTPTAFTDPLMTTLVVAGLVAAVGKRPWGAGLWLGLAVAVKYQAVLFVPLAVFWGAGGQGGRGAGERGRLTTHYSLLTTYFLLFTILLTLAWDYGRTGSITLWQAQMSSYGGCGWHGRGSCGPVGWAWVQWGWFVWGAGWVGVMGVWVKKNLQGLEDLAGWNKFSQPLTLFLAAYLLLHWLLAVPVWERYLLPLVPLLAVWVAIKSAPLSALAGGAGLCWLSYCSRRCLRHTAAGPWAGNPRPMGARRPSPSIWWMPRMARCYMTTGTVGIGGISL
jgi:4-amino-4-deoxy-L-arabinose transferase-like glycosyltransferase